MIYTRPYKFHWNNKQGIFCTATTNAGSLYDALEAFFQHKNFKIVCSVGETATVKHGSTYYIVTWDKPI